jgi:hypothetical protein
MQVETLGRPEQVSNLQPGQCFFFDSGDGIQFGMLTKDAARPGFLIFARSADRTPWVVTGGLPQNVLALPDVKIRTHSTSLGFGAASALGEITSAGGNFYLRAALRKMETVTINLRSGLLEDPPPLGPIVHYSKWSAGVATSNEWQPLIEFPFS